MVAIELNTGLIAFHVIAVVCWFSGLFYLPRLFVYHAMTEDKSGQERFKIMERKLYRGIVWPSSVLTTLSGVWLLFSHHAYYASMNWMHIKLFFVGLLWLYQLCCGYHLKQFQQDKNQKSHVYFRWFNEVPTVCLVVIIVMVFVRPF